MRADDVFVPELTLPLAKKGRWCNDQRRAGTDDANTSRGCCW